MEPRRTPQRSLSQINLKVDPSPSCREQLEIDENTQTEDGTLEFQFEELKRKIKPLLGMLGRKATTELERALVESVPITVGPKIISDAQNLLAELTELEEKQHVEVKGLWNEVNQYWQELEHRHEPQLEFCNSHSDIYEVLKSLKTRYLQRKEVKSKRIAEHIELLRSELSRIWNLCLISEDEKRTFTPFYGTNFNEELLQTHSEELQKWKIYHEKNQEVLQKAKKREEMWKKLRELDAKAEDPSRFINRGGALLKDQTTHAGIIKNLPKLEADLKRLAKRFEQEHGRKVTILGEDVHTLIDREWEKYNNEKSRKKQETRCKVVQTRQSLALIPQSQMGPPAPVAVNARAAKRTLPLLAANQQQSPSPKQKRSTIFHG